MYWKDKNPWTPELEERLITLAERGERYETIAAALGLNKNQVVGKAHRIGVASRRPGTPRARPPGPPVPRPKECQWPIGHPGQPGFRMCGKAAIWMKPYCPEHDALAHGRNLHDTATNPVVTGP